MGLITTEWWYSELELDKIYNIYKNTCLPAGVFLSPGDGVKGSFLAPGDGVRGSFSELCCNFETDRI